MQRVQQRHGRVVEDLDGAVAGGEEEGARAGAERESHLVRLEGLRVGGLGGGRGVEGYWD